MIDETIGLGGMAGRWLIVSLAVEYAAVVCAVGVDFVSGVVKARRAGVRRTSAGYRRTVDKLGRYLGALGGLTVVDAVIVVAVMCLRGTGGIAIPLLPVMTTIGALGMALIEAKSICERLEHKGDLKRGAEMLERIMDLLISKGGVK